MEYRSLLLITTLSDKFSPPFVIQVHHLSPFKVSNRKKIVKSKRQSFLSSQTEKLFSTFPIHLKHCSDMVRRGELLGWQHFHCPLMGFPCIRKCLPCAYYMAKLHPVFPLIYLWGFLSVEHSLHRPTEGFPAMWHNELRHTTAQPLSVMCSN